MYFYRFYTFIIIIVAIMIFEACKKSTTIPKEARQSLDKEGLKFIQIPVGKYFIYKDSATGNQDSVVVTKSVLEQIDVAAYNCGAFCFGNHPAYHYERFSIVLTNGRNQMEWLNATTGDIIAYSITNDRSPIFLTDNNNILLFSYSRSNSGILPTMSIDGKLYNEVSVTTEDINGKFSTSYWAKNIGLIKRQLRTGAEITTVILVRHG